MHAGDPGWRRRFRSYREDEHLRIPLVEGDASQVKSVVCARPETVTTDLYPIAPEALNTSRKSGTSCVAATPSTLVMRRRTLVLPHPT